MKRSIQTQLVVLLLSLAAVTAHAQGNYQGGSYNPGDFFIVPNSFILAPYYSYANVNYYNNSGNKVTSINIPGSMTESGKDETLKINNKTSANSVIATMLFGFKNKFLGANWGIVTFPTLTTSHNSLGLNTLQENQTTNNVIKTGGKIGLTDLFVAPLWANWNFGSKWTLTSSFGMYMPLGRYKRSDDPDAENNTGNGYWSFDPRIGARYTASPKLMFNLISTFEFHTKQRYTDFTEGSYMVVDYGATFAFNNGSALNVYGWYDQQISESKGTKYPELRHQALGIGASYLIWFKKGTFGTLPRFQYTYYTRNKFDGFNAQIGLFWLFYGKK